MMKDPAIVGCKRLGVIEAAQDAVNETKYLWG